MNAGATADEMMVAYSQDAVAHARDHFGVELDYSVDSVRAVETILARLHGAIPHGIWKLFRRPPSEDALVNLSKMYGGYLGEVMKRLRGGEWMIETGVVSPGPVICLRKGEDRVFPPAKVWKRLTNGPEDDVWMYFQVVEAMPKPAEP